MAGGFFNIRLFKVQRRNVENFLNGPDVERQKITNIFFNTKNGAFSCLKRVLNKKNAY